jgi:hypothetical protein
MKRNPPSGCKTSEIKSELKCEKRCRREKVEDILKLKLFELDVKARRRAMCNFRLKISLTVNQAPIDLQMNCSSPSFFPKGKHFYYFTTVEELSVTKQNGLNYFFFIFFFWNETYS